MTAQAEPLGQIGAGSCRVGQHNGEMSAQRLEKRFDDSLTGRWLRRDKYPGWR